MKSDIFERFVIEAVSVLPPSSHLSHPVHGWQLSVLNY